MRQADPGAQAGKNIPTGGALKPKALNGLLDGIQLLRTVLQGRTDPVAFIIFVPGTVTQKQ